MLLYISVQIEGRNSIVAHIKGFPTLLAQLNKLERIAWQT